LLHSESGIFTAVGATASTTESMQAGGLKGPLAAMAGGKTV
jgi:hypothetical protein